MSGGPAGSRGGHAPPRLEASILSQPLLGLSNVWRSHMQDCDLLFVFSDKAAGLAFNTNSLTDFRTSPDD